MAEIRKTIHNKLITDFAALKHDNDTDFLFASVEKLLIDYPSAVPACFIEVSTPSVETQGNQYDTRILGFNAITYELIENNSNQADADRKVDRLSDIEDVVFAYLERLPNALAGLIPGFTIFDIRVQPSIYIYERSEQGLRLFQQIQFSVYVNIDVTSV